MLNLVTYLLILFGIILVFGTAVYASFRAAPWLPVFKKDIKRIIEFAEVKDGDKVFDLGCGDGRVLVGLANNTKAELLIGYEISFIFFLWSRLRMLFLSLSKKVEIRFSDFLMKDLSSADVIFCFLTPMAMKKLKPKFEKELKKGTRVISYSFTIPGWTEVAINQPGEYDLPIHKYIID
ncbi:MAG: class I SAM-dependent methyltransferase [bacterium]|nr:class I SAM-dependent methyltransferase [bacterium]